MNFPDRVLLGWFLALSVGLLMHPMVLEHWVRFLILNAIILLTIFVTVQEANSSPVWQSAHDWYPMMLFVVGFEEVARLSTVFVSQWQDPILLRLERFCFDVPPTEWLERFRNPFLTEMLEFGYFSFYWMLPLVGFVLYAHGWKEDEGRQLPFRVWMSALAIGYATCFTIFLLFPTEGPAHALGRHTGMAVTGPFRWLVLLVQRYGGVHGNAFPSGHVMAAVVSLLAALKWCPRLGWWLLVPTLLMLVGAVFDSYHYASDVIAGAALGMAAHAAANRLLGRAAHGVN